MTKITFFLIVLIGISIATYAQTAGDYRSIANGNWNDATKWQTFNGTNWVSATSFPGQNSGTGVVTVMNSTEITITASLPHPIASLQVDGDFNMLAPPGKLIFSSQGPVSLMVEGSVIIYGNLLIADQYNSKSHTLSIGGSLVAGTWIYVQDTTCIDFYPCPGIYNPFAGEIQTINHDDKLKVVFNTTMSNSSISGVGTVSFQDISFNGIGISLETSIRINGIASFVNGIVRASNYCAIGCAIDASGSSSCPPSSCGLLFFADDATVSGASTASFVKGRVWKQGNDPFTFPIGDGGVYSPLTISAPNSQSEVFSARYVRSNGDPSLWGITDPGLYSVSNCEYWDLNYGYDNFGSFSDNYTGYIDVTASWTPLSGCGSSYITNATDVNLAHFNGTSWDAHGGSGSGTITNGSITWSGVNNFGSFTLGNINTSCLTPSALTATNITTSSTTLSWSPVAGSISYDVAYKTTTTNSWTNVAMGITTTSYNLSGLNPLVTYDWKVRGNCGSSSSAYRVGPQFITQNPCGTPSRLSTTNITSSSALLSWDPVPSGYNYTVQYKLSSEPSWPYSSIPVSSLSYSLSGLVPSTAYDWRVVASCGPIDNVYYGSSAALASFTTAAPVVCDDFYEPNNASGQAKAISLGAMISGMISSSTDVDWFKVTMPNNSNTTLQVALSILPADYDLYVYNKNLILIGSSTATGTSNEIVIYDSRTRKASYYIKVAAKNGAYNVSQCYNLLTQATASGGSVSRASEPENELNIGSKNQLLYPNPASEFVRLSFNSIVEGKSDLQIVNNVGQLVRQYPVNITKGYNQVTILVKDIRPGMYILKINRDGLSLMKRFVIAR